MSSAKYGPFFPGANDCSRLATYIYKNYVITVHADFLAPNGDAGRRAGNSADY